MPIVTNLIRVVTCCEKLSPINIHDISTEWFCGVTWQIKYISQPAEDVSNWLLHKWNIGLKWVKGLMRQNKYSVELTIRGWGGVRGHGKVFKFLTQQFLLLLRELTVARVCFCEMMAIKIRRSWNLFWRMRCPNKILRSLLLWMKDYYILRILSIRWLEYWIFFLMEFKSCFTLKDIIFNWVSNAI